MSRKPAPFFKKGQKVHMIGVSGIGMSALAAFLVSLGCKVTGSDMVESIDIPEKVKFLGQQDEKNVKKGVDIVIASHAITLDNPEVDRAEKLGVPVLTYPEAVVELTKGYKLVAVTGSHGKSTTTAMLAKILIDTGHDPNVIVGTRSPDLDGKNYRVGKSDIFVIEACEYRESMLHYEPDIAVITNIEPDHLDYYKTAENYFKAFKKFLKKVKKGGVVIFNGDDRESLDMVEGYKGDTEIVSMKNSEHLDLKVIGRHNQYNAWTAVKAAVALGISEEDAIKAVCNFEGTWRRLEYKGECNGAKIYDDYGHHPTEVEATLKALKHANPRKDIICVFQPHQYSRTRHFFDEFVQALQGAYTVVIPDIYEVSGREEDTDFDVDDFVDAINEYEEIERAVNGNGLENTAAMLKRELEKSDVCVIMGAGNITTLCDMIL